MKTLLKTIIGLLLCCMQLSAQNDISWFKSFTGNLDKYPIIINLHKQGKSIKGYYYYQSRVEPIYILGDIQGSTVKMAANIIGSPDIEENFELTLKGSDLVGNWKSGSKILTLNLKEYNNPNLTFDYVFTEGERIMFPKMKDSPAASFSESAVWAKGNGSQAEMLKKWVRNIFDAGKSNEDIGKILLKRKATFLAAYAQRKVSEKEAKDAGASLNQSQENNILLVYQSDKLLSLAWHNYTFEGGAHGNWGIDYSAFDLINSKVLKINDIITSSGQKLLPQLLEKSYRKTYKISSKEKLSESLLGDQINPGDNFHVTNKGICFAYVPYEIASYAQGQIELFIPFSELSAYLTPQFKALL